MQSTSLRGRFIRPRLREGESTRKLFAIVPRYIDRAELKFASKVCECEDENTELCHPWTGKCSCKVGWDGDTCGRPCPFYTFGKECQNRCDCKNNAQCSPVDGTCICAAGYRGEDCGMECPENTFGEDCAQKCACKNGASCSPENGRCNCTAGKLYNVESRVCIAEHAGLNNY